MKQDNTNLNPHHLDSTFHKVHKESAVNSGFGLDNTTELIDNGFGLYSSAGLRMKIGPIKSVFYRLGIVLRGEVKVNCGLETYQAHPQSLVCTFPGQIFSLSDKSEDLSAYYLLFKEDFIADTPLLRNLSEQFPFFQYSGVQTFDLDDADFIAIKQFIEQINIEIQQRKKDLKQFCQLYLNLILLQAKRSYSTQIAQPSSVLPPEKQLLIRYKKLVSEHFLRNRKVADYADMLHITSDHLNKTMKNQSGKTAHELIEEMLLMEAKALLLHTNLNISEIVYQLNFNDPSHFNKFFKKLSGVNPTEFRDKS